MNVPTKTPQQVRASDPGRRTWPVAWLLAGGVGLLVALSTGIILVINFSTSGRNTFDLLNKQSVLLAASLENAVRNTLDPPRRTVRLVAAAYRQGKFEIAAPGQVNRILTGAMSALTDVEALIVSDRDLIRRGVVRNRDGTIQSLTPGPFDTPEIKQGMAYIMNSGQSRWGPLVLRLGSVFANYAEPLKRNGRVDGALVAAVSLSTLSRVAADIGKRAQSTGFVLFGSGHVLAHQSLVGRRLRQFGASAAPRLADIGDKVIAAFPSRDKLERFADAKAEGVEVAEIRIGGNTYIAISKTLEGYGPKPLIVGAYFARGSHGQEVARLFFSGVASLIALVVSVILAIFLGRGFARTVTRLARQTALITELEFDQVKALPPSRIREFEAGGVAFNTMLETLKVFSVYVPRALVSKLIRLGPEEAAQPVKREVSIMFTDLVGFTSLTEKLDSGDAAALLNRHFTALCEIIEAENGTVDKFLGDGLMAFWGAPDETPDHAARALAAASAMIRAAGSNEATPDDNGAAGLRMRVGIHTGEVIIGNIGGASRLNYTVIGDAANVASRLEELGKKVAPAAHVAVLISQATRKRAGPGFKTKSAGRHKIKGRDGTITVHRLLGEA